MLPVLTFAAGVLAGVIGVKMLKKAKQSDALRAAAATRLETVGDRAREGLDKAQSGLRQAAVSGLSAVEKSSASLRAKLTPAEEPAAETAAPTEDAAPVEEAAAPAEPRGEQP